MQIKRVIQDARRVNTNKHDQSTDENQKVSEEHAYVRASGFEAVVAQSALYSAPGLTRLNKDPHEQ